ncbi:adenylate kinase [Streptacidiphilus sp. PAMC 29251]
MRIVLIGPPGAGKGTQADILHGELGVPHISTGALFRRHIDARTPLGRQASGYLGVGDLVPDQVTADMVHQRLAEPDAQRGFLLDGFPRTLPQARTLAELLRADGHELDAAVEFAVPDEVLTERLLSRGRADDTPETIRNRQEVYRTQTAPLLEFYADILLTVDATGAAADIAEKTLGMLEPRR